MSKEVNKEIIYILSNPAMPGYIKIGKTTNLQARLSQLDGTNLPLPFECEFAMEVDVGRTELLMHQAFADARVRKNREFFELSINQAISALQLTGGKEVSLDDKGDLDKEAKDALRKAKKRRDRFSFKMVDIPVGSELYFYKENDQGEQIICTTDSNNKVAYEGELMSLSASAQQVISQLGFNWSTISGPAWWCFDGETLDERRQRFESE